MSTLNRLRDLSILRETVGGFVVAAGLTAALVPLGVCIAGMAVETFVTLVTGVSATEELVTDVVEGVEPAGAADALTGGTMTGAIVDTLPHALATGGAFTSGTTLVIFDTLVISVNEADVADTNVDDAEEMAVAGSAGVLTGGAMTGTMGDTLVEALATEGAFTTGTTAAIFETVAAGVNETCATATDVVDAAEASEVGPRGVLTGGAMTGAMVDELPDTPLAAPCASDEPLELSSTTSAVAKFVRLFWATSSSAAFTTPSRL
jgi:hypothetical protein